MYETPCHPCIVTCVRPGFSAGWRQCHRWQYQSLCLCKQHQYRPFLCDCFDRPGPFFIKIVERQLWGLRQSNDQFPFLVLHLLNYVNCVEHLKIIYLQHCNYNYNWLLHIKYMYTTIINLPLLYTLTINFRNNGGTQFVKLSWRVIY